MPVIQKIKRIGAKRLEKVGFYNRDFFIFFLLSILMILVSGLFHVPGVADHPQFDAYTDADLLKKIFKKDFFLKSTFYSFFVIDFFWAAYLLLLLSKYFYKKYKNNSTSYPKELFFVFIIFAALAYLFDVTENFIYIYNVSYPKLIATLKLIFYGLVSIISLLSFFEHFIEKNYHVTLRTFLKSATYSLVVLLIIGVLLPTATQVNSIIVDLYLLPYNLLILMVFAPFFAIVVAHYPSYFNLQQGQRKWYMGKYRIFNLIGIIYYRNKTKDESVEEEGNNYCNKTSNQRIVKINFLLRILGISFYVALFYMVAYSSEMNFEWRLKMSSLSIVLLIISVFLLHFLKEIKLHWFRHNYLFLKGKLNDFYDGDYDPSILPSELSEKKWFLKIFASCTNISSRIDCLKTINRPVKIYLTLLSGTVILHFVLFVILIAYDKLRYNEWVVILSLTCIVGQLFTFVFYRTFRSVLRIVLFNPNSSAIVNSFLEGPEKKLNSNTVSQNIVLEEKAELTSNGKNGSEFKRKKEAVISFFSKYNFKDGSKLLSFFSTLRIGAFSNNITFLQVNAVYGVFNLIFLIVINYISWAATYFSSIIIILAVLFFFYGVLVVISKNYKYHRHKAKQQMGRAVNTGARRKLRTYQYLCLFSIVILLVLYVVTKEVGNNLFTLEPIKRIKERELVLDDYIQNLDTTSTRFYIGCYGGGMKSNAWTMSVLNELYNRDAEIFNSTVGISGVSGGTMGMVNFFSTLRNYPNARDSLKRDSIIQLVATQNILSMDIAHAAGRDLINYLFYPGNVSGMDRSSKVMERYAHLTNDNYNCDAANSTFRGYWKGLYKSFNRSFPIFITNTTNVKGTQGMAVSVEINDDNKKLNSLLYRGADNILEINRADLCPDTFEYTLGYYEAASTSNRFPLISPAAKIETKGHYNDGGVFENSGLFSVYKLFQTINEVEEVRSLEELKQRNIFICIINDKNLFVKHVLKSELETLNDVLYIDEVNYSSEIGAILNSVASTEMTPIAIKSELKRLDTLKPHVNYAPIYLPHKFTLADVKKLFGKKIRLRSGKPADEIIHNISRKINCSIDSVYMANGGKGAIIQPPMSRVMTEPAFEFMLQMLEHPATNNAIEDILSN